MKSLKSKYLEIVYFMLSQLSAATKISQFYVVPTLGLIFTF